MEWMERIFQLSRISLEFPAKAVAKESGKRPSYQQRELKTACFFWLLLLHIADYLPTYEFCWFQKPN
jgi:hypothetical protein